MASVTFLATPWAIIAIVSMSRSVATAASSADDNSSGVCIEIVFVSGKRRKGEAEREK